MQVLILPGFSKENKDWVDEAAQKLDAKNVVRPFYWMHWIDENSKFDAEEKADLIAKHIKEDKVKIVAKSIGTLVASLVYKKVPNQIEKIIFCGIPVNDLKNEEINLIKSVMQSDNNKFVVFQNDNDPHGTYEEVKDFGNVVKKESSEHNYPYFEEFNKLLK